MCECPVWCDGMLNGRRIRKSLGTTDWARALRRLQNWERGADTSPEISFAAPNMERAMTMFLSVCGSRNLKESTVASYYRTITHLLTAVGKDRQVASITVEMLGTYRASRKIKPRTWRKEIEYLRAFFSYCVDREWCTSNPAKKLRMPLVEDIATLPFTGEEVDALLAACDKMRGMWQDDTPLVRQRARALLLVLLYSGLRIGDVAKMRRSQLEASGHLVLRTMKNNVPVKVLLHPDAAAALRALPAPGGNPKYFFWSGNGQIDNCSKSLRLTVARVGRVANVHAHPHRFRDTFAVELITNGADLRTVQMLLGHRSIKTTERHYAHFVPAHQALLDSAASRLDFGPKAARPVLVHPLKKRSGNP